MENSLVQPIAVLKTGSHEATVEAAARSSLGAYLKIMAAGEELEEVKAAFATWLDGRFTKTVRRGSPNELLAVEKWLQEEGRELAVHRVEVNDSVALAVYPLAYEAFPKALSKLQVRGTEFIWNDPREVSGTIDDSLSLSPEILVLDTLTTGKAAAQAAHALWLWYLKESRQPNNESNLTQWQKAGLPLRLRFAPANSLTETLGNNQTAVSIRDAGLTEIEPNTLTAMAWTHAIDA